MVTLARAPVAPLGSLTSPRIPVSRVCALRLAAPRSKSIRAVSFIFSAPVSFDFYSLDEDMNRRPGRGNYTTAWKRSEALRAQITKPTQTAHECAEFRKCFVEGKGVSCFGPRILARFDGHFQNPATL